MALNRLKSPTVSPLEVCNRLLRFPVYSDSFQAILCSPLVATSPKGQICSSDSLASDLSGAPCAFRLQLKILNGPRKLGVQPLPSFPASNRFSLTCTVHNLWIQLPSHSQICQTLSHLMVFTCTDGSLAPNPFLHHLPWPHSFILQGSA